MKRPLRPLRALKPLPASEPASFGLREAIAMQAFAQGKADEVQQKIAWEWIVTGACGVGIWPYRETERETLLALGRQFVAQQLIGIAKVNISALKRREEIGEHG